MDGSAEASLGARGLRGPRALAGSSTETGTRAVYAASLHRAEVCDGREKESGFSSTLRRSAKQSAPSNDHKCPAWGPPDPGTGSRCFRILWSCLPAQWPAYYPPVSSVEWGRSGRRMGLPPSWGPPVPRAVGGKERGLVGTFLRLSRGPISPGPGFPTEAPAESPARLQAASPGGREAAGAEAGAGRHLPSPLGQACDASGLRKSVNPSSLSALSSDPPGVQAGGRDFCRGLGCCKSLRKQRDSRFL